MAARGGRRGSISFFVALAVGLLVVAWATGRPPSDGPPLDPRSSGPAGARGLVLFLDELGADVRISDAGVDGDDDLAVLLDDRLSDRLRRDLIGWVQAGGTLVVADPFSLVAAPAADPGDLFDTFTGDLDTDDCVIDALADVDRIDAPAATFFEVGDGRIGCFGDETRAYVVSEAVGAGRIVSVGSPSPFTNDELDEADHAVLAGALMAPRAGERVVVLDRPPPGDGDETLSDLVSDGVVAGLFQLAIAFSVYALFRARRLGRPVEEPLPVPIAGSELVAAVGHLLQRSDDPGRAAVIIRADTRRRLAVRFGLPVDAPADVLARALDGRTTLVPDRVSALLTDSTITDEDELVDLARSLDGLRQEVLHGQTV